MSPSSTWRCSHLGTCCLLIPGGPEVFVWFRFRGSCPAGELRIRLMKVASAVFHFKKLSSEGCFSGRCFLCLFYPVSVYILCVFCCSAKHRKYLLLSCTVTDSSRCVFRLPWAAHLRGVRAPHARPPHHQHCSVLLLCKDGRFSVSGAQKGHLILLRDQLLSSRRGTRYVQQSTLAEQD